MIERTTTKTVTFARPFKLSAVDEVQPAGSYTVETAEELIQTLSFPAYRLTGIWIRLPAQGHSATATQAVKLTSAELVEALAMDAIVPPPEAAAPSADCLPADRAKPGPARCTGSMMGVVNQGLRGLTAYAAQIWRR